MNDIATVNPATSKMNDITTVNPSTSKMIQVKNLTKTFDDFTAVRGFNMNVVEGSIYGLVGVNGSGKTTVIKHLAGVLPPEEGEIFINGALIYDNADNKASMAYVPDELFFFPRYNLKKMGSFFSEMYKSTWDGARFTELVALLELDPKRQIGKFSKGMQKQSALALALSTCPKVLLLDEPIDGLDPLVRSRIFKWIIKDVADRKMTVLISSHNLKEMDGICDTVGIVKGGRMLIEQDLDQLKAEMLEKNISEHSPPTLDEIFIHLYETSGGEHQQINEISDSASRTQSKEEQNNA